MSMSNFGDWIKVLIYITSFFLIMLGLIYLWLRYKFYISLKKIGEIANGMSKL